MKTEKTTRSGVRLHVFTCDVADCGRESAAYPGQTPRRWVTWGAKHHGEKHTCGRCVGRAAQARKAAAA